MLSTTPARAGTLLLALTLLNVGCADQNSPLAPPELPDPSAQLLPLSGVQQVSSGLRHACALLNDGTLSCWGAGGPSTVPAGLADVTQVSAGAGHTCALDGSEVITCWGENGGGQLDVPAGLTSPTQVSAGFGSTCAVDGDGMVVCWGANTTGTSYSVPDDLGPVVQVLAGYQYYCARRSDGTVKCWGDHAEPAGLTGVTDLGSGAYHICASRNDGTVTCWAQNIDGAGDVPAALTDAATADAVEVSSGEYHNCARLGDGTLTCWGRSENGQTTVPAGLSDVVQVSAGYYFTCALRTDETVVCWGDSREGQASPPTTRVNPTAVFTHPAFAAVGDGFDLALTDAHVPGYTGSTSFTFAFDCGDGTGYSDHASDNTTSCAAGELGERTVKGKVRDGDGDETEYTGTVVTAYAFAGFFAPVADDAPNVVRAGRAVPIKFSLAGDQGLDVLADGSPASQQIACAVSDDAGTITETITSGSSGLSYDPATDTYTYVWKTKRAWSNSCRRLMLAFVDGAPPRTADFHFIR
jgi:hypothetical protein